jgi:HEAT repeat protein
MTEETHTIACTVAILFLACAETRQVDPPHVVTPERPSTKSSAMASPPRAHSLPVQSRAPYPSRPSQQSVLVEPETASVLSLALTSTDYATRLLATEALGCMPASVALGSLERQLGDPEEDVRAAAVLALARHDDARADALLRSVRDDGQEQLSVRVLAASSLLAGPDPCH